MKRGYFITACTAAILLAGCGNVDTTFEKKNVEYTTTTPFTFFFTTTEAEGVADSGTVSGMNNTEEKAATTRRKVVTEEPESARLTTTTPAPTTTTTTTTTTAAPTTTAATSAPAETTPTETQPTETTTTFFDPNAPLVNTYDLAEIRTVAYKGLEFTVGDRFSDFEEFLGDPVSPPTSITSFITGLEAIEYHYKMLTVVVEDDTITSIEIARTEIDPELEPSLTWGLRFGQNKEVVTSLLGPSFVLTDPDTLMYSDGNIKLLFYIPNDSIERITVRQA